MARFKKGESGNPGGRPKSVRELLDMARAATPKALEVAIELLENRLEDSKVRLDAAKFLASYGLGKPPNAVPDSEEDESARPLAGLSREQLLEIVQVARAPAEGH